MLEFAFMQRALLAAVIIGVICGLLGFFVILRRLAFIGVGISHSALGGVAICVRLAVVDPSGRERRRMSLIIVSGILPLVAHWVDTVGLLPVDYPITPAALAMTGLLMTVAVRQYRLLDVQPVARRDVIEASDDAVVIVDVSGQIVDCNPATARLLDCPRSSLLGESLDSVSNSFGAHPIVDEIATWLKPSS